MGLYRRSEKGVWWFKHMRDGVMIYKSTRVRNKRVAEEIEAAHLIKLARQDVGLREQKVAPLLRDFLKRFLTFAKERHSGKPATYRYYRQGCDMLLKSPSLSRLRLDQITDESAQQFASENGKLSASGVNRGLRTLRRACNLAHKWGDLERSAEITLAAGEVRRDRVLTVSESEKYLAACPEPWKTCAILINDEGFRPMEVFKLEWSHLNFEHMAIAITSGKSKAARRTLPMTPRVQTVLLKRWKAAGEPNVGFVFPSAAKSGHFNQNVGKDQHSRGLEGSKVAPFPPYTLRHTALTRLAEASGGDPFVVARIAGHSSIAITARYVHPQEDQINRVFSASLPDVMGTKLGTARNRGKRRTLKARPQRALKSA